MDGVKDRDARRALCVARGARQAWSAMLVLACLLSLAGCDFVQSSSGPRSRHQAALERAFPDPRAQALAIAAEHGDAAEVRRLMRDEGVDPDVIFGGHNGGMPLLAWPIYSRSPDGLRAMLEAGADPNAKKTYKPHDRSERSHANAMVWAAEQDDPVYLDILLDHGGDPDTRNGNNEALLFHAFIKQNKWRNVQLLVERGADVNANVSVGRTILEVYASRGGFMMAHWLLERGADPQLEFRRGEPFRRPDSHVVRAIYWHPGDPHDPTWQRKCQQKLLAMNIERPPLPESYRKMREAFGFPHEEAEIPLL